MNIVLGIFYPGFATIASHDWNKIQNKIIKSLLYVFISIIMIAFYLYIDMPLESKLAPWLIIIPYSLGAFGGLLFISGLRDFLLKKFPDLSNIGAFIFIMIFISLLTYLLIKFIW